MQKEKQKGEKRLAQVHLVSLLPYHTTQACLVRCSVPSPAFLSLQGGGMECLPQAHAPFGAEHTAGPQKCDAQARGYDVEHTSVSSTEEDLFLQRESVQGAAFLPPP